MKTSKITNRLNHRAPKSSSGRKKKDANRTRRKSRKDLYQSVTDAILEHLKQGTVPWQQPWRHSVGRPRNFHTGRPYSGVNVILLGLLGFASPYWLTCRQTNILGGHVRKGERGSRIVKYGTNERDAVDRDETDEKQIRSYLQEYVVFNALQVTGIEFPEEEVSQTPSKLLRQEKAEAIIASMPQKPDITEGQSTRAVYIPATDTINIPELQRFDGADGYYLTLFHELIHSTGHESRLNRKSLIDFDRFGDETYSKEELVAEMGAAFLGMEADIVADNHEQSAAYISGWLKVLSEPDHRHWMVQSASQAGKAADFILGALD